MAELSRPCGYHIGSVRQLLELCLEHIARSDLLLFVLPYWQWRDELLASSTVDEEEIFLADLYTELLLRIVELADPFAFREGAECELAWVGASELNHFQP
jgi:hypothetical protein